jgi:uncharacterized protein
MELLKDITAIKLSLYLPRHKVLIFSDIHIGYEESLNKKGVFVPRMFFEDLYNKAKDTIARLDFKTVIINGDLKHEFGGISTTEWRHTLRFLDLFKDKHIIMIKGNHDKILGPIAKKRNIELKDYCIIGDIMILHGDRIIKLPKVINEKINTLIIGHEHPAISLKTATRHETYKCYLVGKTKDKKHNLIVMPSYNEVTEGTNVLNEDLLSPYLQHDLTQFRVVVYGKELYDFGRIKDLKKLNK